VEDVSWWYALCSNLIRKGKEMIETKQCLGCKKVFEVEEEKIGCYTVIAILCPSCAEEYSKREIENFNQWRREVTS